MRVNPLVSNAALTYSPIQADISALTESFHKVVLALKTGLGKKAGD